MESLSVNQECIKLYQSLVFQDPALYTAWLASALGSLSKCFSHMFQQLPRNQQDFVGECLHPSGIKAIVEGEL